MGRVRWKTALPVFVDGYFSGFRFPTRGPAGIHRANPLNSRVLPGPKRIRGGEARGFPSDTLKNTHFVSLSRDFQENKGLRALTLLSEPKRGSDPVSFCRSV